MDNIFNYSDFKEYLNDFYENKKKQSSIFSHRYIAQKIGFSPGYFSRILKGEKKLSDEMISKFSSFLKLNKSEKEYFEALVNFNQANNTDLQNKHYRKMLSMKKSKTKKLEKSGYDFFKEWYHTVVFSMIKIHSINSKSDFKALAKFFKPSITADKIIASIALLQKLGLVETDENGNYQVCQNFMSTGDASKDINIRNFLKSNIGLAEMGIETIPASERSYSTMVVSVSKTGYEKICDKISETRKEINRIIAEDSDLSSVYHINFQLFPTFKGDINE